MGQNSKIEWTHHTFNPWWGCAKVSAACRSCYAESWAKRVGQDLWGKKAPRRTFSAAHWREPLRWNSEAEHESERRRVFCASMADVFEDREDLAPWRSRLWDLINQTPWLDWLLLTKRPHMVGKSVPWTTQWPVNVWLGTTVESQYWAVKRIPELLKHPAHIRFLSCEPLLTKLDLTQWLSGIDWVIAGGESGARARPMHPLWAQSLRDQCVTRNVAFHFKQWGHWAPNAGSSKRAIVEIPDETGNATKLFGVGKAAAGRVLDGRTWDQVPTNTARDGPHEERTDVAAV